MLRVSFQLTAKQNMFSSKQRWSLFGYHTLLKQSYNIAQMPGMMDEEKTYQRNIAKV